MEGSTSRKGILLLWTMATRWLRGGETGRLLLRIGHTAAYSGGTEGILKTSRNNRLIRK